MERTRSSRDTERGGRGGREESSRGRDRDDSPRGGRDREESPRGGGRSSGSRHEYKPRSADQVKRRAEQSGGNFDKYIKDSCPVYKVADDNVVRICPPTWDKPEHFGYDIYVHYSVGPDQQTYLCLDKMLSAPCPICDERKKAVKDGDTEYAEKLKPKQRVLYYIVDREHEKEGVQIWAAPWTVDRDISTLLTDRRTGEILPIDDPVNGYDIEFSRQGKADRTKYVGIAVARRESELGNEEWLDFVYDNPLPSMLKYYEYDHIAKAFGGGSGGERDDNDGRRRGGSDLDREQDDALRDVETRGRSGRGRDADPELDWDGVHGMSYDEMTALIDEKGLKMIPDESKDDGELADWICEDLDIKKAPAAARRRVSADADAPESTGDRLANMRRNRER